MFDFTIYTEQRKREPTGFRTFSAVLLDYAARAGLDQEAANRFLMRFLAAVMSAKETALLSMSSEDGSMEVKPAKPSGKGKASKQETQKGPGITPDYVNPKTYGPAMPKAFNQKNESMEEWEKNLELVEWQKEMVGARKIIQVAWNDEDGPDAYSNLTLEGIKTMSPRLFNSPHGQTFLNMFNKTHYAKWSARPPPSATSERKFSPKAQDANIQNRFVCDMGRAMKMMDKSIYLTNWHIYNTIERIRGDDAEVIWVWFPWENVPDITMTAKMMTMELSLEAASGRRILEAQTSLRKIFTALQSDAMSIVTGNDSGELVFKSIDVVADAFKTIVDVSC